MAGIGMNAMMKLGLLLPLLAAAQVQAQTYKCQDAAGRITYSQAPCRAGALPMGAERTSRTRRGDERVLGACPGRDDLREMEKVMTQLARPELEAERALLQSELAKAKSCRLPGAPYRIHDWKELVTLYPELAFKDPAQRALARQRIERIHEQVAARQGTPAAAAPASAPAPAPKSAATSASTSAAATSASAPRK